MNNPAVHPRQQHERGRPVPVTWRTAEGSQEFESIRALAAYKGVCEQTVRNWLLRGYTGDSDLPGGTK